jgi:regulator of RNase E activity RraA
MMRGVAGVVTDGGFRDSPEIAKLAIPTYHSRPSAPTNLTLHQAIDINVPIGCGDAPVWPGDVVVGDGEGVVIIPAEISDEVADEAFEMTAFEDFVTEKCWKAAQSSVSIQRPTSGPNSISPRGGRRTNDSFRADRRPLRPLVAQSGQCSDASV